MAAFDDDVIASITEYMNSHQPDANLRIVQVQGGEPSATEALLTTFDGDNAIFTATVDGAARQVVVPWSRSISRREQISQELMGLYEKALRA